MANGFNVNNYPSGAALNYGDQRLGFVDAGNGGLTLGLDNMGNMNRGAYDGGFNTPVGRVNYGYDGDTVYGQIEPAYYLQALANLLSQNRQPANMTIPDAPNFSGRSKPPLNFRTVEPLKPITIAPGMLQPKQKIPR